MTEPVFPSLPGLAWSVKKSPRFSTRTQKAVSGRQLRLSDQQYPIWQFTLNFDFLRDANDTRGAGISTGFNELRTLANLYLAVLGGAGAFQFTDPTDSVVTATLGVLASGDGATTDFQLYRQLVAGGVSEPVTAPNTVSHVYVDGVDPGGWTVDSATGVVTFGVAPANGTALTWAGTFYFRCHFLDDTIDLENFMLGLWELRELKFESVLP